VKIVRLTSAIEVLQHWDFFIEGFESVTRKTHEVFDLEQMQKTLCYHARLHHHSWIAIAVDEIDPLGFIVMEEATPLFAPFRSCIARVVYHRPGAEVLEPMMHAFEKWAKEIGFKHYVITTRRHSGAAIRFFQSPKFGFRKGYITFEKEIR
jgi:hypothetical protein